MSYRTIIMYKSSENLPTRPKQSRQDITKN